MALRISEAVLSGVSTWRDYELHRAREKVQADNHNAEMKLMRDHHAKEEILAKQIYLVEKFTEIEQHFQQLNADLLTVSKESGKLAIISSNSNIQNSRFVSRSLIIHYYIH